jgi:tetratricopeptide (TPR) repeat protein
VEALYYHPQQKLYIVVYKHILYSGPSLGLGSYDEIEPRYYNRVYDLDWNERPDPYGFDGLPYQVLEKIPRAELAVYPSSGIGNAAYLAQKGDLIIIQGDSFTNGSWGVMDKSRFEAQLLRPEAEINYFEQNRLGWAAYQEKDWEKAILHFENSIRIYPAYRYALFNLACTYALAGRPFSEGVELLERLLALPGLSVYYWDRIHTDTDLESWWQESDFKIWSDSK